MAKKAKKILIVCLLSFVSMLSGMDSLLKDDKDKKHVTFASSDKIKIKNLDDVDKMKHLRDEYRSKHHVFALEHNQNNVEKKLQQS